MLHRLLAEVYIPNPNNYSQINHVDGDSHNNNISNLEWCNAKENNIHAIDAGLRPCKINMHIANQIRQDYFTSTAKALSVKYSLSLGQIRKIVNNERWVRNPQ